MSGGLCEPHRAPRIENELERSTTKLAPTGWLAGLFTQHDIDEELSSTYLNQSCYYKRDRWDLPHEDDGEDRYSDEGDMDGWKKLNDRVQHRFMDIFNDIIHYFGFGDARRALATEATSDERQDIHLNYDKSHRDPGYSTRPDLIVLGHDHKQLPRSLDSYDASMSKDEEQRRELYRGCVAVGKVERCQRRGETDRKLEKVANYARCSSF